MANYLPHTSCFKTVNLEWMQGKQIRVMIEFRDQRAAWAYRKMIHDNRFHRRHKTEARVAQRTTSLMLPAEVAKIRSFDTQRGFIFVFSSITYASQWRKHTPLWRQYLGRQDELCIDPYLTESESVWLRRGMSRVSDRTLENERSKESKRLRKILEDHEDVESPRQREERIRAEEGRAQARRMVRIVRSTKDIKAKGPRKQEESWRRKEQEQRFDEREKKGLGQPKPPEDPLGPAFFSRRDW